MTRLKDALVARLGELRPWMPLLGPRARQIVEMRAGGTSAAAIAAQFGFGQAATTVRISQARQRLEVLRARYPDPSTAPAAVGRTGRKPGPVARRAAPAPAPVRPIAPKGWDRADPSEDFTDIEPIAPPPALVVPAAPPAPAPPEPEPEPEPQPEVARVRRRLKVVGSRFRSKTIAPKRLSREEQQLAELLDYPEDVDRPATREQCSEMARPCPFVSCSHHLYLDVNQETGAIKLNFPHLEVWEMAETCSLDVADRGGITLEEVGAVLNITRERVRQLEVRAMVKLGRSEIGNQHDPCRHASTYRASSSEDSALSARSGLTDSGKRTGAASARAGRSAR